MKDFVSLPVSVVGVKRITDQLRQSVSSLLKVTPVAYSVVGL